MKCYRLIERTFVADYQLNWTTFNNKKKAFDVRETHSTVKAKSKALKALARAFTLICISNQQTVSFGFLFLSKFSQIRFSSDSSQLQFSFFAKKLNT